MTLYEDHREGLSVRLHLYGQYFNHGNEEVISDKRCCFLEQQTD